MNPTPKRQSQRRGSQNQLRIIAGKWRSRRLEFPAEEGLRPTGDRIRETLFNWLAPIIPGSRCLDAFAGSGALGFEALSRGAREVVFLEKNPRVYQFLLENQQNLRAEGGQVILTDTLGWLAKSHSASFDIIFVDPPFSRDLQNHCLDLLAQEGLTHPGTKIYLEAPRESDTRLPPHWTTEKEKTSGNISYRLLRA